MDAQEGTLFYDMETGRFDIRFGLENYYGGLHCGTCFEVWMGNSWSPVRIEFGWETDEWYLDGLETRLDGLKVRI